MVEPMRVLWILPYLPWPATSGGKTRQLHLLRALSSLGFKITLLVQSKQTLDSATQAALDPYLERLIVLPRRSPKHPATLLRIIFGKLPILTCINGFSTPLERVFSALLLEEWDIIQVEHSYSFQPYDKLLETTKQSFVLTEHNLESSLGGATYGRFPGVLRPFIVFDQWRARAWERHVFDRAQRVIAVTDADAQNMQNLTKTPVDVVVNGVDTTTFAVVQPDFEANAVLFVGNYEYPPNVDAINWVLNDIMPLVWRDCPNARFIVAGFALPEDWSTRWLDKRIVWKGFVEDLTELQSTCSVFLAPLRHGGGSKLKVLEALAAGLPLVSTAQGVSGLSVKHENAYLQGESAQQLATQVCRVLKDRSIAHSLSCAGRSYVRLNHDWSIAAEQLISVYQRCKEV